MEEGVPSLVELFSNLTYEKRAKSFKSNGEAFLSQQRRREERLKAQQQERYNYQKLVRAALLVNESEGVDQEEERGKKRKAEEISGTTKKDRADQKQQKIYKDTLMTPEPFEDGIPEDLNGNWLCMPYPQGRRVIVVSHQKRTTIRLRNGTLLSSFQSLLPGGGKKSASAKMHCILDCFLHEPSFTLYDCLLLLC